MKLRRVLAGGGVFATSALGVALLAPAASASAHHSGTLFVSVRGTDSATCGAAADPCLTIDQAIMNAATGGTIRVKPGVYHEQVEVTKPVTLRGFGATIDAAGLESGSGQTLNAAGVLVLPSASGTTVEGLRVHGAYGEGILVMGASDVTIRSNRVYGNDLGTPENTTYLECQPMGEIPGDCGEGIHLMSATGSQVVHNRVTGNSGGVLVSDDLGPASHNLVARNFIAGNLSDCGVTMPSHNPNALSPTGQRQPTVAGVYDNTVEYNRVIGNGTEGGGGSGVLIAAPFPGTASYDNTVTGNVISGNGMSGVTIHAHAPNQDVNGNVITGNTIGPNNMKGDPDASYFETTGVLVWSAVVPVTVTISGNHIHGNQTPIWTSDNVTILP